MKSVTLKYFTREKTTREVCRAYWRVKQGAYVYSLQELAERYAITPSEITHLAKRSARAYDETCFCEHMGVRPSRYFSTRVERVVTLAHCACVTCDNKWKQDYAARVTRHAEIFSRAKQEEMVRAIEEKRYYNLSEREYCFLIALARSEDTEIAMRETGLAFREALSILKTLSSEHLIDCGDGTKCTILSELKEFLLSQEAKKSEAKLSPSPYLIDLRTKMAS